VLIVGVGVSQEIDLNFFLNKNKGYSIFFSNKKGDNELMVEF
jgi:hypothetical protein